MLFKTIYWYIEHILLALNWLWSATLQTIYDTNAQKQWQNRRIWRKRSAFTSWCTEKLQFLSKCHVFTDLPVASHMSCLTWVRNSFPFSSDTVWSLLAEHAHSLPPSSCPVSQVHGEAYKICRVHCRLRRLRTSALKVLTVTDQSHPCGILCPGLWDMAWISSASCLPQAGIASVVCTCHLSCP